MSEGIKMLPVAPMRDLWIRGIDLARDGGDRSVFWVRDSKGYVHQVNPPNRLSRLQRGKRYCLKVRP